MKGKLLFLGLGLLATALLIALALSWLQQGNTPSSGGETALPQPLNQPQTARQAYTVLQQWSSTWAEDAGPVALSYSFQRDAQEAGGWSFQLYSPSRRRLANVLVTGSEVWVLREQAALYPQEILAPEDWPVDSDTILTTWWNEWGRTLWQHSRPQSMTLHLGRRAGLVTWQVSLLGKDGQILDFRELRAATGDFLAP